MSFKKCSFVSRSLSYSKEEINNKMVEVIYFDFYNPINFINNDFKYNTYYILYEDFAKKINRFDNFIYIKTQYGFIKYKLQKKRNVIIDFYYKNDLSPEDLVECSKLIELHITGYENLDCDLDSYGLSIFSNSIKFI